MQFRAAVAVIAFMAVRLEAQRPNLAGDWVRSDSTMRPVVAAAGDAAFRRGDMGVGWGTNLTIEQRPDSLVVLYDLFSSYDLQPRIRFAYAMDGSESSNGIMIGHAAELQRSRLSWQADGAVITTLHPLPDALGRNATTEVRQTLTLASPTSLVVETTRAGVMGGASSATRATYTRK